MIDTYFAKHRHQIKLTELKTTHPFCSNAFAAKCKWALASRIDPEIENNLLSASDLHLLDNDFVYVFTNDVSNKMLIKLADWCARKRIKLTFLLHSEPVTNPDIYILLAPVANNFFHTNNLYSGDVPCHSLPLAWRDRIMPSPGNNTPFDGTMVTKQGNFSVEKDLLCLLSVTLQRPKDEMRPLVRKNVWERINCYQILKDEPFITNTDKEVPFDVKPEQDYGWLPSYMLTRLPPKVFLSLVHRSKYVLDPPGFGIATHRFWEAIYLDAIPIVKRTYSPMDRMFETLPCLIVDSWKEVTESRLEKCLTTLQNKMASWKHENPNFFTDFDSMIAFCEHHT
jgi:hypothetical protein